MWDAPILMKLFPDQAITILNFIITCIDKFPFSFRIIARAILCSGELPILNFFVTQRFSQISQLQLFCRIYCSDFYYLPCHMWHVIGPCLDNLYVVDKTWLTILTIPDVYMPQPSSTNIECSHCNFHHFKYHLVAHIANGWWVIIGHIKSTSPRFYVFNNASYLWGGEFSISLTSFNDVSSALTIEPTINHLSSLQWYAFPHVTAQLQEGQIFDDENDRTWSQTFYNTYNIVDIPKTITH